MEKLMDTKLRIGKRKLIDELNKLSILELKDELNKLSKEFIVDYLIGKLTPEVTVYNSKSMFKSLPPPISPKEIRILSSYDAGNYAISAIEYMRDHKLFLNPIQIYILNHTKIYAESDKIVSDSIIHNTNEVLDDMKILSFRLTELLLEQYNIIQVYKQIIIQKESTAAEAESKKERNLEKEKEIKLREENQTKKDVQDLIEGIRKEEEAAKAKRDLEELERKKFLSSSQPQPQPQIKSQEELAEAERIRAEAERKRLNDDIRRQEKYERDVAQGLVSSGPDSFLGPSLGNNSGDSFYTRENNKKNANTNALLNALNPPITKEELSNFILIVCDQIDKQIGIFIFWMELVKELFDSLDKKGNIQKVQIDTINKYRAYRASITKLHTENLSTLDDYKIRIACIIHEQQFKILDNAMKETINYNRFILTKDELTHMQQCIAILLCLTPHAFFISEVPFISTYTNEMSQELNKELVQYEYESITKDETGNPVYLYGATVRFDTYTDSERPWYISEQTKFIFGVKKCDRAIEDTGTFINNPRGFANIKKLMEDLGLGQNRTSTSSYFFLKFPAENLLQETLSKLQEVLSRASPTEKVLPFLEFFSLNKKLTESDNPKELLQNNEDQISDLIKSPILKIKPQYTQALLVYIRDERSKCSYIGTYRLTGKKPKGGRKTRRQRRTKQRKHKVKGQKKTRKQRRKKTQKRRSKK